MKNMPDTKLKIGEAYVVRNHAHHVGFDVMLRCAGLYFSHSGGVTGVAAAGASIGSGHGIVTSNRGASE